MCGRTVSQNFFTGGLVTCVSTWFCECVIRPEVTFAVFLRVFLCVSPGKGKDPFTCSFKYFEYIINMITER